MPRTFVPFVFLAALAVAPSAALAQRRPAFVDAIFIQGNQKSQAARTLTEITKIGPRLTGSPQYAKSAEWAADKFRKWGLKNVRLEDGVTVPVGFTRGRRQSARMIAPFESEFEFTTYAWTNGTRGPVRGEAVFAPTTPELLNASKAELTGKWVVLPRSAPRGQAPSIAPELVKAIEELPIAGFVRGAPSESVMTHGSWVGKTYETRPGKTSVLVRRSDWERLSRNISYGRKPVIEVDVENVWLKGPVVAKNVIADIPGTERPDEVVIVSGHLDSWDGPGSQGASDNGTGVTSAMEAARILMAAGLKPKRTIRFILWTGEEQGLHGSRQYVKDHAAELPKHSAVFVDDAGAGYIGGYSVLASQRAPFDYAIANLNEEFPALPMQLRIVDRMPRGGGSDHSPFNAVGVPGFFTVEGGDFDYGGGYHNGRDRLERILPKYESYLRQAATAHALVAYLIADLPTLLPRDPAPQTTGN